MVFGGLFTRLRVLNAIVCSVVVIVVWVCGYGRFGLCYCGWFVVIVVAGAWRSGLLLVVWVDCFLLYMLVLGISFCACIAGVCCWCCIGWLRGCGDLLLIGLIVNTGCCWWLLLAFCCVIVGILVWLSGCVGFLGLCCCLRCFGVV